MDTGTETVPVCIINTDSERHLQYRLRYFFFLILALAPSLGSLNENQSWARGMRHKQRVRAFQTIFQKLVQRDKRQLFGPTTLLRCRERCRKPPSSEQMRCMSIQIPVLYILKNKPEFDLQGREQGTWHQQPAITDGFMA